MTPIVRKMERIELKILWFGSSHRAHSWEVDRSTRRVCSSVRVWAMDLVSRCKDKLAYFRIKELKDVLTQLGKGKQGKKQDLVDRILESLADDQVSVSHGRAKQRSIAREEVAKIIDDIFRKMQAPSALELASKSHSGSGLINGKPKEEEVVDGHQLEMKVHCPCGSSLMSDSMIMCQDPGCLVLQHIVCVLIPEKPMEGVQPIIPSCFYCETCRINRADPFWLTVRHPLPPTKLMSSGFASDGCLKDTAKELCIDEGSSSSSSP